MSDITSLLGDDLARLTRRVRRGEGAAVDAALQVLPGLLPGPETAALLVALPATNDRYALSILLEAWDRQVSWAQAQLYGAAQPFACADGPERGNLETVRLALGLAPRLHQRSQLRRHVPLASPTQDPRRLDHPPTSRRHGALDQSGWTHPSTPTL